MDDMVERAAKAAWNENPQREMGAHYPLGETGSTYKHLGYVLWDDDDMRESDRDVTRAKFRAALSAALDPEDEKLVDEYAARIARAMDRESGSLKISRGAYISKDEALRKFSRIAIEELRALALGGGNG